VGTPAGASSPAPAFGDAPGVATAGPPRAPLRGPPSLRRSGVHVHPRLDMLSKAMARTHPRAVTSGIRDRAPSRGVTVGAGALILLVNLSAARFRVQIT
jgi:hypothetical protein